MLSLQNYNLFLILSVKKHYFLGKICNFVRYD